MTALRPLVGTANPATSGLALLRVTLDSMRARLVAIVLAVVGIAFAGYVEYGTTRAADVERSFALFVFEAGPWALLLVLALLSPFCAAAGGVAVLLLMLDLYAYFVVFVAPPA